MKHKHVSTFVIIAVVVVALFAIVITFRSQYEGKATELVIIHKTAPITPCCCVKQDPSGVKQDHTALYFVRGPEECKCYPSLNWVPTDLSQCHIRRR